MSMNQSDHADALASVLSCLLESVQAHLRETGYPGEDSQLDRDVISAKLALQAFNGEDDTATLADYIASPRYVVDGTNEDGETTDTGVDSAPFYVFDVQEQENISGPFTDHASANTACTAFNRADKG